MILASLTPTEWLSLFTLVAAIMVAVIYFFQLRAMQDATKAQNLAGLVMYLQSPEVRKARRFVLSNLKGRPYSAWKGEDTSTEQSATALAAYGVAGVMIEIGRVDPDPIIKNWGPSIFLTCLICEEFIKDQQVAYGPIYWSALDSLRKRVEQALPAAALQKLKAPATSVASPSGSSSPSST